MSRGWFDDRYKHSLASKGIKTLCGKEDYKKVSLDEINNTPRRSRKEKILEEVRKEGINPIKLDFFLKNIKRFYLPSIGNAGNCGVFAVGLKRFIEENFDRDVNLVAVINEYEPEGFYHVAIEWNEEYYDLDGVRNKWELESRGQDPDLEADLGISEAEVEIVEIDEQSALKYTGNALGTHNDKVEDVEEIFEVEWEQMEKEIK